MNQTILTYIYIYIDVFVAFAWLKCEEALGDRHCYEVLKTFNITGRAGNLFGNDLNRYVRLSLVKSEDDFDLLLRQIKKLVDEEIDGKFLTTTSTELSQSNETKMMMNIRCHSSLHMVNEISRLND
jgi:hypothetical protein